MAKVSELNGSKLDYWVGRATFAHPDNLTGELQLYMKINNDIVAVIDDECGYSYPVWSGAWKGRLGWMKYSPSTEWARGGPLIEEYKVELEFEDACVGSIFDAPMDRWVIRCGGTPLIAAMRCIVASKYGEEVEDD